RVNGSGFGRIRVPGLRYARQDPEPDQDDDADADPDRRYAQERRRDRERDDEYDEADDVDAERGHVASRSVRCSALCAGKSRALQRSPAQGGMEGRRHPDRGNAYSTLTVLLDPAQVVRTQTAGSVATAG